jgi:hypothetical protein
MLHDRLEERPQIHRFAILIRLGDARLGIGVHHRKIELVFGRIQIDEQVVNLVQHFLNARVRPVDLVDHYNRRQPRFERLHQHVARLRQWAFARVHQQHHAVDKFQRALHLAAEIAVTRGIDNIDFVVAVAHAGGLGENRDSTLALQFIRIHGAFGMAFVGAKHAALIEHRVDQRGFAVINVSNDRDVTNLRTYRH